MLLWFQDLGKADVAVAGGKGASLGELTRAGIRVPPGFVVSTSAYRTFMDSADPDGSFRGQIEALGSDDLSALQAVCERIRRHICESELPERIRKPIGEAYRELGGDEGELPVAVRSSATAEDSADASFAGLQDTYLWVRGEDAVCRALKDCWSSWFNDESVNYRRERGLSEKDLSMAVVVQTMVDPVCSGVMFSRSPTTGDRSVVAIEGSWGLGSCIVSGEVTPDRFMVNKVTGEVADTVIAEKAVEHVPDPDGNGVVSRDVPAERRSQACLDDAQITALASLARKVERHYGCAQDMEWALVEDETPTVYLLQSRPETVWADRAPSTDMAPRARAFEHVFNVLGGKRES